MATKRPNEQSAQRPNSQLRVLFVEILNGADTTIEEALRTVERMRRSAEIVQQPQRQLGGPAKSENGQSGDKSQAESTPDLLDPPQNDGGNGDPETEQPTTPRAKRGQGPKKDRNAGIELVGDLDFVPKGKQPLKAYFAEKATRFDMDQVLVLCHYLQHVLGLAQFGPSHIRTGFKHVDKPVPVDLRTTIHNLKRHKAWLSYTDIENIRVTTEGDNRVEHELGKKVEDESA